MLEATGVMEPTVSVRDLQLRIKDALQEKSWRDTSIVMAFIRIKTGYHNPSFSIYTNLITLFILIPYTYYIYKWKANVRFRDYAIRWETDFWHSCGKILLEVFLTIITVGIYYPYAILRLYKYFIEKTVAVSENATKGFGFDLEAREDFFFLWGADNLQRILNFNHFPIT